MLSLPVTILMIVVAFVARIVLVLVQIIVLVLLLVVVVVIIAFIVRNKIYFNDLNYTGCLSPITCCEMDR